MARHLHALLDALAGTERQAGRRRAIAAPARPDADALAAAWLADRYLFAGEAEVRFLPVGQGWAAGPPADCVVGLGGLHDAHWLLFDSSPPARAEPGAAGAARLVWDRLCGLGAAVGRLAPLVAAVHDGVSSPAEEFRRRVAAARERSLPDLELYRRARRYLDGLYAGPA
jgi:hypothetical protein